MEPRPVEELGSDLVRFRLQNFEAEFDQVLEELFQARSQWRYSHKIRGRWENTYVPICEVPSVPWVFSIWKTSLRMFSLCTRTKVGSFFLKVPRENAK